MRYNLPLILRPWQMAMWHDKNGCKLQAWSRNGTLSLGNLLSSVLLHDVFPPNRRTQLIFLTGSDVTEVCSLALSISHGESHRSCIIFIGVLVQFRLLLYLCRITIGFGHVGICLWVILYAPNILYI